jgi:LysR family transcriptional activator of nhaA
MEWLNFNHLHYFWVVVREGGFTAASQALRLAQPTISAQIKSLEEELGEPLFDRSQRRRLVLTEMGRMVYRYADEMFSVSQDLMSQLKNQNPATRGLKLNVGADMVLHKLLVYRLLQPVYELEQDVRVVVEEGTTKDLLASLSIYNLDVVLADNPLGSQAKVKAFSHLLGESDVSIFGTREQRKKFQKDFPRSLHGAPFLLPTETTSLRRSLDHWFDQNEIQPNVIGEFQDSALLKVFGQEGRGLFAIPTVVADEVCRQYRVEVLGSIPKVRERIYAITIDRKMKNPAVLAIAESARDNLFDQEPKAIEKSA